MVPEEAAWQMMKSKEFQNAKCEHGSPSDTPIFSVGIPQIGRNYTQVDIGIMHGEMRFRRYCVHQLADKVQANKVAEKTCSSFSISRCRRCLG